MNAIEGALASGEILLIKGWLEEKAGLPVVFHDTESEGALDAYLSCVRRLRCKVVAVDSSRLDEEDLATAISEVEQWEQEDKQTDILTALHRCREHIGKLASINVWAFVESPPVVLHYGVHADWHGLVFEPEELSPESDDTEDDDDGEYEKRKEELARSVSVDAAFARAKNRAQREHVVRQAMRRGDVKDMRVREIAERASAIFELEVKE